jgi:hypothetical protein
MPHICFLTLRTYGTWLHGDARGSVDRAHRAYRSPMLAANARLEHAEHARLRHAPVQLDAAQRRSMTDTIEQVCRHREWTLYAFSVRTEHVHIVFAIAADLSPEKAMNTLKSWVRQGADTSSRCAAPKSGRAPAICRANTSASEVGS